ncbi:CxxxxCH/CxxCH domain-containing protein [Ruminococcaceae bacterium AM28-23LB]|nr:CxxxxCH/CxxCH domain-containing protein [Ruminococcaceae bacterium AM28-23LB]
MHRRISPGDQGAFCKIFCHSPGDGTGQRLSSAPTWTGTNTRSSFNSWANEPPPPFCRNFPTAAAR